MMRRLYIIVFFSTLLSCTGSSSIVNDFYVPDIPFMEGNEILDMGVGQYEYNFELFKYQYKLGLEIQEDLIQNTLQKPKTIQVYEHENLSDEEFTQKFYAQFLNDDYDVETLENILTILSSREIGTDFDLVQVIVSFVQAIPYEEAADQKYPLETLYLNKGDCSDKSVLLGKLLSIAGYDVCLFVYEKAKHMSVGLKVDESSDYYHNNYIYIESTGYNPIGNIPKEFAGGIKIEEEPIVVYLEDGDYEISGFNDLKQLYNSIEETYGNNYFNTTIEGKIIIEELLTVKNNLDSLQSINNDTENQITKLKNDYQRFNCDVQITEMNQEKCFEIQEPLNVSIEEYNGNIPLINNLISAYNQKINNLNRINKSNYIKN